METRARAPLPVQARPGVPSSAGLASSPPAQAQPDASPDTMEENILAFQEAFNAMAATLREAAAMAGEDQGGG